MSHHGSTDGSPKGDAPCAFSPHVQERREVLAGRRCMFCGTVDRLIVVARIPGVTRVGCTSCWAGPTDVVDWGQR